MTMTCAFDSSRPAVPSPARFFTGGQAPPLPGRGAGSRSTERAAGPVWTSRPSGRSAPGATRWPAVRELANKAAVYALVRLAGPGPRPAAGDAWEDLVAAVYRRAPFSALFRLERLGHDLAATAWRRNGPPRGLLSDQQAAALPASSLILLHGGMGLAFADRLVRGLPRRAPEAALAGALGRFVELCRACSRPGWAEPALEPLGVVMRVFRPRWTAAAGRLLGDVDPVARACYWHGVGRGIYFLPRHFLPGSARRAVAACRREPPDAAARMDALDGLFFAAAMVNLRHPRVLEEALASAGERADEEAAVAGGVTSAVLARARTTPGDPALSGLLAHRPAPRLAALWERRVRGPVLYGLALLPLLEAHGLLPTLARHRHLPTLAAGLAAAVFEPRPESLDPG